MATSAPIIYKRQKVSRREAKKYVYRYIYREASKYRVCVCLVQLLLLRLWRNGGSLLWRRVIRNPGVHRWGVDVARHLTSPSRKTRRELSREKIGFVAGMPANIIEAVETTRRFSFSISRQARTRSLQASDLPSRVSIKISSDGE